MCDNINQKIRKYLISEFSKITYMDKSNISGGSFLYSGLCLDIIDVYSIIIQIENKFCIHVDENNIDLCNDMTVDEFCDLICGEKKDFDND